MPFIAPLIGAAIGGIAATAIGQAVIGAALSLAMGALARRLTPKTETQSMGRGAHLRLVADTQMPRVVILGEAAVAGSLVYHNVYNQTANLELVLALADHECEALTGIWIDGQPVTWHADTGLVDEYPDMRVRFYSGAWSQTADADLIANSAVGTWLGNATADRWSSSHRGRGICYVYVNIGYQAGLYKGRQPSMLFKVKGAKLYDWRKDSTAGGSGSHRWGSPSTWEWTDNPVVCWYNYRRGIYVNGVRVAGMSSAADSLPLDAATAAANACDELVSLKAGGSEKRYRLSAAIVTAQRHREVIRDMAAAVAGEEIDTGGELRLAPGVAQSPVMALTDDDMMAEAEVEWSGRASRRDLINAVHGAYRDPSQRYEAISLPVRQSSTDETSDGGRFETRYDLDMVTSPTQGQRVLEILRRRARRQGVARTTFRAKACVLEPGDWITWTSERFGWSLKTFEVVTSAIGRDLSTELVLREIDADVYAWTAAVDELDVAAPPDLPGGDTGIAALTDVTLEAIEVTATSSAASRPGLRLSWDPVADPSVVEIEIEVRRQGDTAALGSRKAYDPAAGQASWVDGVLGSTVYQARARPVSLPPRAVTWSAWVTADISAPQVVEVGFPPPASVGEAELDEQTRFELGLITAIDEVQGSAAEDTANALAWAQSVGDSALAALVRQRQLETGIRSEQIVRQTENAAFASQISAVTTTLDGHSATLLEHASSIDGMEARWGIAINVDGRVVGLVQLDGDATQSAFTVLADRFTVSKPDGTGTPIQVFVVGNVDGVSTVGIDGNLLIDGSILARHIAVTTLSAIAANIGTVTAGRLQNAANTTYFDLNTGAFQITAAS